MEGGGCGRVEILLECGVWLYEECELLCMMDVAI